MIEEPFTRPPRHNKSLHVVPPVMPINADEFDDDDVALPDVAGLLADAVFVAARLLLPSSPSLPRSLPPSSYILKVSPRTPPSRTRAAGDPPNRNLVVSP